MSFIERTIAFAEQRFKTDVRYILHGGFWLAVGQFFSSGSALIMAIAFANLLPADIYGIYKYILSLFAIISITSLSGIDAAYSQSVARNLEGGLHKNIATKIRWSMFGTAIGIGIAAYYAYQGNMFISISMVVASIFMPFMNAFDIYGAFLGGKKLFREYSLYNVYSRLILTLAMVGTIILTKNIIIIMSVYFLVNTAVNGLYLIVTEARFKPNNTVDTSMDKFGKHLSFMDLISLVTNQLDTILVFHYLGAAELAIYSIAVAPTEQIKGLLKNINFLALPKFANRSTEEIKHSINDKLLKLIGVIGLGIILYILLAPVLFGIVFPKYYDSIIYTQILAPSIIAAIISTFLYTILKAKTLTKQIYHYNIFGSVASLVLLFPMISHFGLMGAVLARLIVRTSSALYTYYLVKKI